MRQLADEVVQLRTALLESQDYCRELEKAIKDKDILINNLKEENKIIKLGNRLTENSDGTELKLKINQMIRVIDKSLEILKTDKV